MNPLLQSPFKIRETDSDGLTRRTTIFDGNKIGQKVELETDLYRDHLSAYRGDYVDNNGMRPNGTRRHVATIPVEMYMAWAQQYGNSLKTDPKLLRRLIREFGLSVVGPGSY